MLKHYKLDSNRNPVQCSLLEWAEFFNEIEKRSVKQEHIKNLWISTCFIGNDLSFGASPKPLLFESMVFKDESSFYCMRYPTWDEAEKGHARLVKIANWLLKRRSKYLDKMVAGL